MTTVPFTIVDNFFDNPKEIRDYALSLKYIPEPDGRWPGKRTALLNHINPSLEDFVLRKIYNLFFEETPIGSTVKMSFQKIEHLEGSGWPHQDKELFTFLIYLHDDEESINCGTSIYSLKKGVYHPFKDLQDQRKMETFMRSKFNQSKTGKMTKEQLIIQEKFISENFTKTIDIKDKFNRLVCFPSDCFHSANTYSNLTSDARLTLLGFVERIAFKGKHWPIIRSKQSHMI